MHGNANVVISHDRRANLAPVLASRNIALFSADNYLLHLIIQKNLYAEVIAAVRRQRADYTVNPYTPQQMIDEFERNGMTEFAESLKFVVGKI